MYSRTSRQDLELKTWSNGFSLLQRLFAEQDFIAHLIETNFYIDMKRRFGDLISVRYLKKIYYSFFPCFFFIVSFSLSPCYKPTTVKMNWEIEIIFAIWLRRVKVHVLH